ncbi:MAG: RcpC/CpaB family pilus assembly protein [Elusimicrobiota bacterium]
MTTRNLLPLLALAAALVACRAKPIDRSGDAEPEFEPPAGKRAFSLSIDKSQTQFLSPGDAAEIVMMIETPRSDGTSESRSEVLSPRAEVLRVERDWGESTGLIQLALTPEEAQFAALAADREDRLFLNKVAEGLKLEGDSAPAKPALAPGSRGLAVLVYPDQQEFLQPGDRVDVIATRRGGKASGKSELTAVTLFQDVTVLGVRAAEGNEEWSTVQLMLTSEQTQAMTRAVAAEDGIVLTARSPQDHGTRPVEPSKMSRKIGLDAGHPSSKS